jgi:Gas vesicle protein G
MFLIDDLAIAPARFVLWIVRQVHEAAKEEMSGEKQRLTGELGQLHAMLESGRLSEEEFDVRERIVLDRLDALEEQLAGGAEGGDGGTVAR